MPARRKPIAELIASGAARRNPQRMRGRTDAAPTVGTIGDPPSRLAPEVAEVWRELAAELPEGVAGVTDRSSFEVLACLTYEFRVAGPAMRPAKVTLLIKLLQEFSLSPAARSRSKPVAPQVQRVSRLAALLGHAPSIPGDTGR